MRRRALPACRGKQAHSHGALRRGCVPLSEQPPFGLYGFETVTLLVRGILASDFVAKA
jgi:hypothetical protein